MSSITDFPKWDAHHHLWQYDERTMDWIPQECIRRDFLLQEWVDTMNASGIDRSILVQVHQTWAETLWMHELSMQTDRIAGVVGWVDLFSPSLIEDLQRLPSNHRIVGFRHIMQAESSQWWAQKSLAHGIQVLGKSGFSYDVLLTQSQLPQAVELLPRCGETRLIIDHLAKPKIGQGDRSDWEKYMKNLALLPNVAVKISGFTTETPNFQWNASDFIPYFAFLLTHFGPQRLMLGSDWPVCLMAATYSEQRQVVEDWLSSLSRSEQKWLWYESAAYWYGL